MRESIRRKAVYAVRLIDSVTGKACSCFDFRLTYPAGLSASWKRESGMLVLIGGEVHGGELLLESPVYETLCIPLEAADCGSEANAYEFLYPKRAYRPAREIACVEGRTEPFAWVRAVQETEATRMLLAEELRAGAREAVLFAQNGVMPTAVRLKQGETEQWMQLFADAERKETFLLSEAAAVSYTGRAAEAARAFVTRADSNGSFALFLSGMETGCGRIRVEISGTSGRKMRYSCAPEREGRITLRETDRMEEAEED